MLDIKEIENGKFMVKSTIGKVDIGEGPAPAIICTKDEIEYITEVEE